MNKEEFEKELDMKLASLKEEMMQKFEEQENTFPQDTFPQDGDRYWFIDSAGILRQSKWDNDVIDRYRLEIGNISPTGKEMEFKRERLKVIKELERHAEPKERKWDANTNHCYILWDYRDNCIDYYNHSVIKHADIYFETEQRARAAVEAVGEDRVKRYYLRVED